MEIRLGTETLQLESKCRSGQFKMIYKWLAGSDALVIKADRSEPLIALGLERFAKLLASNPRIPIEMGFSWGFYVP